MTGPAESWRRVSKREPCPVCGGESWCTIAPDGKVVRCKWTESPHPSPGDDGAAWLHYLDGAEPRHRENGHEGPPDPKPGSAWALIAKQFADAVTTKQVEQLAERLHVDPAALGDLGIGWNGKEFTFPMFGADGAVCGIRTRDADWSSPRVLTGGKLGVFKVARPDGGTLLICEGESDTAAALTLGFRAIGVPGAGQAAAAAAAHARGLDAVIVRDNDHPGAKGAATLQKPLGATACTVRVIVPPVKDLRAWLIDGATREDVQQLIDEQQPQQGAARRAAQTPRHILAAWAREGELQHLPTGFATLDAMTGGGPTLGSTLVIVGAPDAGKTLLEVVLAENAIRNGCAVGLLSVDEEPTDTLQRFLQRRDFTRRQCELRALHDLARMDAALTDLHLLFYDESWTIETAAADLAAYAKAHGVHAMLGVDSIQTVTCDADGDAADLRINVTARMRALRAAATRHRMLTAGTSEMARRGYANKDQHENANAMAVAKESGAIEYRSRVLLALTNLPGEDNLVELRIVKNKLGRRHRDDEQPGIVLRIDRAAQTLTEVAGYTPQEEQSDAKVERNEREIIADAACLAVCLSNEPGLASKKALSAASAATRGGMGDARFRKARGKLGAAIVEEQGLRTTVHLFLDGSVVPPEVVFAIAPDDRPKVLAATRKTNRTEPPRAAPGASEHHPRERCSRSPIGGACASHGGAAHEPLSAAEVGGASDSESPCGEPSLNGNCFHAGSDSADIAEELHERIFGTGSAS